MLRGLFKRIGNLLTGRKVDESLYEELEESLILADVSIETTERLLTTLRRIAKERAIVEADDLKGALREAVVAMLGASPPIDLAVLPQPAVWVILGVNGTGKTTSVGKLAYWAKRNGARPLLAAADTFRAAAIEQLQIWAERVDVPVVAHQPNADPAAVTFDALQAARARGNDLVLVDTAGRLHTKHNLMEELRKIARIVERETGAPPSETLLVLDASTGQNGLVQARAFTASVPLTGIVLTKLDGTAKGGIVLTIRDRLNVPIKFVGSGEQVEDLEPFDSQKFADAMF